MQKFVDNLTELVGFMNEGEFVDFTDEVGQVITFLKKLQKNMGTEKAHTIIDLVEFAIRKHHPFIEKMASQCEGNTLLHGEVYYNLENEVVEELRSENLESSTV